MSTNKSQDLVRQYPYLIITPDGAGSKGDEALISGCLSLLQGQKALLLTPNRNQWCDALVGRTHLFEECSVPLEEMPDIFHSPHWLIVIGADTLDGSCGYEAAHWRLEAVQAAVAHGGKVVIFCSIRSDMEERLIQEWKSLPDGVSIFLRDPVSEENFARLVERPAQHFSDLAFFAPPLYTERGKAFRDKVQMLQSKKHVIGLEISETMFRSFNTVLTDENRRAFAWQAASLTVQGQSPIDTAILLLTHDTRSWDEHWSDYQYACAARERLEGVEGFSCIVQPPELVQAELLTVLPFCDLLICGRMHMSITACRAGVVPIVVAGTGKSYTMVDKVRGMCREWLGSDQNLVLNLDQIPQLRDRILCETELHEALERKRELLQSTLSIERAKVAELLKIQPVVWEQSSVQETALIHALQRSAQLSRDLVAEETLRHNKEAHIELLLQSERDLQGTVARKESELENLSAERTRLQQQSSRIQRENEQLQQQRQQLKRENERLQQQRNQLQRENAELQQEKANAEGECQQLRDKENQLKNDLEATRNSRTWRLARIFAAILRFFIPVGSKRALFCRLLWTMVRHPIIFFRNLTPRKIKKTLRMLRRGDMEGVKLLMRGKITGEPAPSSLVTETPEIEKIEVREKTIDDYPVLQVPQWDDPTVSIVVPVYNQFEFTYHCVESILKNSGDVTYEILIANDCSTDLTTEIDKILPGVRCITNEQNLRFLRNCNHAAKSAKGKYILFLNNDTQVQDNWLQPLVTLIESADDIGLVGSKLIYPDGRLQEAGGILWRDGSAWNFGNRQNPALPQFNYVKQVDYISGAAIMLSRALWEEIGGFDETFVPAYCEDSDLCFTVRKMGYRVMYQPLSVVVHFEGVSNGTDTSAGQKKYQIENSKKFREKWAEELAKHPENGENVFQARDYSFGKKTLLMVDHYVPMFDKDAGSRTVFQYLKLFVSQGFNVKFIGDNFYQHEPYTTVLQQMGIEVLYGPDCAAHWKDWILENAEHFDYVFLNRPHIAPKYLDFLRLHTHARIMYYGHDLAFLREMREYEITGDASFRDSAKEWQPKELALMRDADMAYYPSYVEVEEIHRIDPDIRVKAIPAYLFEDVQWEGYDFAARKDIMFIGGFGHRPNVDAVKWVADEILPALLKLLPDVRIHILGSNPPKEVLALASDHLIMEGFVTDEQLDAFYRGSRLSLVPLRYGAGIKGKVIEAMRYGTPVVTTPTGAEGIPDAEAVMAVEETAEALAKRIAALYNDADALTALSRKSVAYVQENYSPNNAVQVIGPEFDMM